MQTLLLSVHVLAGILFVGPVAVTTSVFPRVVPLRDTDSAPDAVGGSSRARGRHRASAEILHGVTRRYGLLAVAVPVIGLVLAAVQGRLGEIWIILAMILTAVAGGLLALRIVPAQRDVLESPVESSGLRGLQILSGVFNLLWAVVVVLMIVRPGAA